MPFVAWSPNDKLLLTCGIEEVVKLRNVEASECKITYGEANSGFVSCGWFQRKNNLCFTELIMHPHMEY